MPFGAPVLRGFSPSTAGCDYPAEEDVEAGVVYGNEAYTGKFVGSSHFTDVEVLEPTIDVEVN